MKQEKSVSCVRRPALAIFANCLICLVVSWLFLFSDVYASTYYVRTDGNNNCNGLTDIGGTSGNCAFRTVLKGIQTALGGDNVIVHTGNYTGETLDSVRSGSAGNLITIKAETGETVSISRIDVTHNYNVIWGFRVTSPGQYSAGGIQLNGNYNKVLYNTILGRGVPNADGADGIAVWGGNNNVSYNTLDGQNNGTNTSFTRGISIEGSNNEITHNLIKDANSIERAFELNGQNNHIAYNEVRNCRATSGGGGAHPDIIQTFNANSRNHIIENNYFHDFDGQFGNLETATSANWIFRNNVIANVAYEMFIHIQTIWYNNTFYRVATGNTGYPLNENYAGGSVVAKNNAFVACGTSASNGWYTGADEKDYNFVSNSATGGTKTGFSETHGVNGGDPQLVTYNNNCSSNTCNFNIQSSSVLIDKGVIISGFSTDYANTSRPQGLGWDIGAYEYVGVGGGSKMPLPPSIISVQ